MVLAGSPLLCIRGVRSVFDLSLALPALFELFVKRERPQQVLYRILPNFVEFLLGRPDLGWRDRLLQCATARCCPGCPAAPAGADLAAGKAKLVERSVDPAGFFGTHRGQ